MLDETSLRLNHYAGIWYWHNTHLYNFFESFQRPLSTKLVLNNRLRVPQFLELGDGEKMERVACQFCVQALELGNPVADIIAVRVALLSLALRVEDALRSESSRVHLRSKAADLCRSAS